MRFGKNFQENLCQLMLEDRPFFDQIMEVLDVQFFEKKYLQIFAQTLINYRNKYNTHPNSEVMMTSIENRTQPSRQSNSTAVRKFYARIHTSDGIEEAEFIKDKAIDFCRKQVLKGAMIKSASLLKSSSFEEIEKVIKEALVLGTDNNFGHDFRKDLLKRFELVSRDPMSTGWSRMDEILKEVLESQSWASSLLQLVLVSLWFSCISQLKQFFKEKLLSTIRSNLKILWSVSVLTVVSPDVPLQEHRDRQKEIVSR